MSSSSFSCPFCSTRLKPTSGAEKSGDYKGTCTHCKHPVYFRAVRASGDLQPVDSVSFTVNDTPYTVQNASPSLSLADWLKQQSHLKGTKQMCREGGCGACVVALTRQGITMAVNSCLFPLLAADGCAIETTEGIGNSISGFHPIQQRLAEHNGSQCGFCSPGMVMSMYSLLKTNPTPTKREIEDHFDGSICRCTGYRGILDAMMTFAGDEQPLDMEDIGKLKCVGDCANCSQKCCKSEKQTLESNGSMWFVSTSLEEVFFLLAKYKEVGVQLVAGDTGKGVFKHEAIVPVYVSLTSIPELHSVSLPTKENSSGKYLLVGAAVTLSNLIISLRKYSEVVKPLGAKFQKLADHLQKIANFSVRNVGTWAGNLMLAYKHNNFPSDVLTIMQAAGATLSIADRSGVKQYSLAEFLQSDMASKVIVSLSIPYDKEANEQFETFKIMPRHQNAHAYVNAGFSVSLAESGSTKVGSQVAIVYGGIGVHTVQAVSTEKYLEGKDLADPDILKGALATLSCELVPDAPPAAASAAYRKSVALSLFYKFYLSLLGPKVSSRLVSAMGDIDRPVSTGVEDYSSDPSSYPLTQPMPKITATLQASGEAQYLNDIPFYPNELQGSFILSTQANATLESLDVSAALELPGVFQAITAKDIPASGVNNWRPAYSQHPEPLFVGVGSTVDFAGQSLGLILADSRAHADAAARAVKTTYKPLGPVVLTVKEAVQAGMIFPDTANAKPLISGDGDPLDALKQSKHQISGEISFGNQYHFYMETQRALVVPIEDGFDVVSSTQHIDHCQRAIAQVLGITESSVNVSVKRIGGGYGGKIHNAQQISCGAAVAASVVKRPARIVMDIDSNMRMLGSRPPYMVDYQIGFDDLGKLDAIIMTVHANCGFSENGNILSMYDVFFDNAYYCPHWKISSLAYKTHTPANTACRAPGSLPSIFVMESVMEHVAKTLGKTAEEIRSVNFYQKGQITPYGQPLPYCTISSLWSQLMASADYKTRVQDVTAFNKANRWKKKGLSVVPLKFGVGWGGAPFNCLISIYAGDASVAISTGGIEMGQGLNTKVIQVAASTLGIHDISLIKVKPTTALIGPNNSTTGASVGSELNCAAVLNACQVLNERIKPIRDQMASSATWKEVVSKCYTSGVNLSAQGWVDETSKYIFNYCAYGVTCTEVELDVLTGEHQVLRVDILYDCGESINPEIDVGQAQGGFVMGMGYWLTEHFVCDPKTGELLTSNTWEYKPPSSKDIPIDFRIAFLKNAPNPLGILRSKAVGEPPLCMSCSSLFALKHAIESARSEIGKDTFFPLNGPATVDVVQTECLIDSSQFSL